MVSKTSALGAVVALAGICAILASALPAGATTTRAATSSGTLASRFTLGVTDETPTTTTTSDVGGDYGQEQPKKTVKGKISSAKLSKKSFSRSQAGKVKLSCTFKPKSKLFAYVLSIKKGAKWTLVKSVRKTGAFKKYTTTVKRLFAGKAVKRGSYRLKLSADGNSKVLTFRVT